MDPGLAKGHARPQRALVDVDRGQSAHAGAGARGGGGRGAGRADKGAPRGGKLFRGAAACRETGGEEATHARRRSAPARDHRRRSNGPGRGGALSQHGRAGGNLPAATAAGRIWIDVRVSGVVEQGRAEALAGVEFRDRALPLRVDSSICRRQWPHRTGARLVGTLPSWIRHAPRFLGRRVLLGGSPALLRGAADGATARRRPQFMAGVQRGGAAADARAGVATHRTVFRLQGGRAKLVLRPKQEQLLQLLRARGGLSPRELWDGLAISKQGAMDLLRPLLDAGLIERVGTLKHGRYVLK